MTIQPDSSAVHANHGPSRRGFLGIVGGCFAALVTNVIPAAGVIREPRYWIKEEQVPVLLDPCTAGLIFIRKGARSDGQFFFVRTLFNPDDMNGLNRSALEAISSGIHQNLRLQLDEFLDCDCTVGYYCEKHAYMNPKSWPVEDVAELDEVAVQSI